jgi:hypothetical protein
VKIEMRNKKYTTTKKKEIKKRLKLKIAIPKKIKYP